MALNLPYLAKALETCWGFEVGAPDSNHRTAWNGPSGGLSEGDNQRPSLPTRNYSSQNTFSFIWSLRPLITQLEENSGYWCLYWGGLARNSLSLKANLHHSETDISQTSGRTFCPLAFRRHEKCFGEVLFHLRALGHLPVERKTGVRPQTKNTLGSRWGALPGLSQASACTGIRLSFMKP